MICVYIYMYIYIYTHIMYVYIYIYTHRCIHRFHTLIIPSSFFSRLHYKYLLIRGTRRDKFKWEADGLGNHRRLRVTEDVVGSLGSWHLFWSFFFFLIFWECTFLVNVDIKPMEHRKDPPFWRGATHYEWSFSMDMLNYQRKYIYIYTYILRLCTSM